MLVIDFRAEWEVVGKFCDGSSRWAKSVMREFRDHFCLIVDRHVSTFKQ